MGLKVAALMNKNIIEASNVIYNFKQVKALDNLCLQVEKGSIYALLGLNGSGKTTFVRLLTGQLMIQSGNIKVFGQDLSATYLEKISKLTGYVPENKNMYSYMTAKQMLDFTVSFYKNKNGKAAARSLELFDIPMNRRIGDFSKGMKSQLALTLALCGEPELLILDEPTDGLDPVKRNQFFNIILDMVSETEKTVFMTTNSISDVEKIADHTGIIKDGQLRINGETGGIVENSRKVRIALPENFTPDFESWQGVMKVEKESRSYLVHIGNNAEGVIERMKELPSIFMDVINMNLEDIFIEINGGRG